MTKGYCNEARGIAADARSIPPLRGRYRNGRAGFFHINDGKVQRFHDLAMVETLQQDRTLISINRAQPAVLPIVVTELERHPLGTRAFVPMNGEAFVVVVAAGGDEPDMSTLRAFISNGRQG